MATSSRDRFSLSWASKFPTKLRRFTRLRSRKDNLDIRNSLQPNTKELCRICQKIDIWEWTLQPPEQEIRIEHHKSYRDLIAAASGGCKLCIILRTALRTMILTDTYLPQNLSVREADSKLLKSDAASLSLVLSRADSKDYDCAQLNGPLFRGFVLFHSVLRPSWNFPNADLVFRLKTADENADLPILGRLRGQRPDLHLARGWLDNCTAGHVECSRQDNVVLPTRLIICGPHNVHLIDVKHDAAFDPNEPYIALSHCWGSVQPLRTTIENIQDHIHGISLDDLPQTFQDAVTTTKFFGLKYIWIDSLCIIQDSTQDWQQECSKMADIYSNAFLTIAASDAPNSTEGFLQDYQEHELHSCELPCRNAAGTLSSNFVVEHTPANVKHPEGTFQTLLSRRGWALQERLLSRRTLSFTKDRMIWECNKGCRSDIRHHEFTIDRINDSVVNKMPLNLINSVTHIYKYWREIVVTYSACSLSVRTDKLPALSGLARAIATTLNDEYFAGVWKNDLHNCIAWYNYCSVPYAMCSDGKHSVFDDEAPTWSWASSEHKILFCHYAQQEFYHDLSILSVNTTLLGLDAFGQVHGGLLRANGCLKKITVQNRLNDMEIVGLDSNRKYVASIYFDSRSTVLQFREYKEQTIMVYALLVSYDPSNPPQYIPGAQGRNTFNYVWTALALEKVGDNKNLFRRVGLLLCDTRDRYLEGRHWFDDCPRQIVEII